MYNIYHYIPYIYTIILYIHIYIYIIISIYTLYIYIYIYLPHGFPRKPNATASGSRAAATPRWSSGRFLAFFFFGGKSRGKTWEKPSHIDIGYIMVI